MSLEALFWSKVKKELTVSSIHVSTPCWIWTGGRQGKGYGNFFDGKQNTLAHRYSFSLLSVIPSGKIICHRCDNPACVNPEHLFLGTMKDNAVDSRNKGRMKNQNKNKAHCSRGHAFSEINTGVAINTNGNMKRYCKRCRKFTRKD